MRKKKNVDEISLIAPFPVEEHALIVKDERSGQFILQADVKPKSLPYFAKAMFQVAVDMMESAGNGTEEYKRLYAKAAFGIVMDELNKNGVDPIRAVREMLEEMGYK